MAFMLYPPQCSLVERVACAVPDDFKAFVPILVRLILATIGSVEISEWEVATAAAANDIERLEAILRFMQGIRSVLTEYLHIIIPTLVNLTDGLINSDPDNRRSLAPSVSPPTGSPQSRVAIGTVETISILLQSSEINPNLIIELTVKSSRPLPARVAQPFLRILGGETKPNKEVGAVMIGCLCVAIRQLGASRWISFYNDTTRETILEWQATVGIVEPTQNYSDTEPVGIQPNLMLPVSVYDEVVNELSFSISDIWNFSDDALSGSGYSLGRTSDNSLSQLADNIKPAPSIQPTPHQTSHKVNMSNLQRAWDVSNRSTREDWEEWFRRFSVQLLREAPSPALRACAELAQTYQPLARELFAAAFVCCWAELTDQYRSNLRFSLEVCFSADASLEILTLLLNLAEFTEHIDTKSKIPQLGIDISILAELALRCRAYARALHYKEREYTTSPLTCVEKLIDINKKLDLPEAASGVLRAAKIEIIRQGGTFVSLQSYEASNPLAYSVITGPNHDSYGIAGGQSWADQINMESWLAKLGAWAEAVSLYEEKLMQNKRDVNSILGCLQCYDARGDWQQALDLAEQSWGVLSADSATETGLTTSLAARNENEAAANYEVALKFCAQSAWRLGKWEELDTYSSLLVQNNKESGQLHAQQTKADDYDGAFYKSILHIHRGEFAEANQFIDSARKAMDGRFTALLAESYKRAYPSLVAAQNLSELEEIINFRQFEDRRNVEVEQLHGLKATSGEKRERQHLLNVWRQRLDGCRVDAEVHASILAVR